MFVIVVYPNGNSTLPKFWPHKMNEEMVVAFVEEAKQYSTMKEATTAAAHYGAKWAFLIKTDYLEIKRVVPVVVPAQTVEPIL
jgi:hypothetical protein